MSEEALQTLTSTLASLADQAQSETQPTQSQPSAPEEAAPAAEQSQHPTEQAPPSQAPETPTKRRPGRPKGSGKKQQLIAAGKLPAEPKPKRPVGRPRKDGLPAGSVGPKRPPRPRKRPPGEFASGTPAPASHPPSQTYPPPSLPGQWGSSISAPPMGSLSATPQIAFPIDPTLDRDDWVTLARHRPDVFLHSLVTALAAPNPVSVAGCSVEEAFRTHLISVMPTPKQNGQSSTPVLYTILKTFWLPSSPAYFSLTASSSASRTPSEHRFMYWDPFALVFNGIVCPICNEPLINRGPIATGPIKIYDLGKPFFIIGCEYICRSETCLPRPPGSTSTNSSIPPEGGRRFASTDASILRVLPGKLRDEFPAKLLEGAGATPDLGPHPEIWSWKGMGVSTALWNMARASLRAGLKKDGILSVIKGIVEGVPPDDGYPESISQPPAPSSSGAWPPAAFTQPPPPPPAPSSAQPPAAPKTENAQGTSGTNGTVQDVSNGTHAEEEEEDDEDEDGEGEKEPVDGEQQQNPSWSGHDPSADNNPTPGPSNYHQHQYNGHPPTHEGMHPAQQTSYPGYTSAPPPSTQHQPYLSYYPYPYHYPPPPPPSMTPLASSISSALKRPYSMIDPALTGASGNPNTSATASASPAKRVRHCVKCGSQECKGKGGRAFCKNPCQDCGRLECGGRNSKRPDRLCGEAWTEGPGEAVSASS
ncbi:hypothetical protein K474DRAFT_1668364 [Panus rudis PR-1116 ss-1]|nr:hypothetical protein K474DRAFT_1668364 [Panus rudis PR-1116 ss-1]